MQKKPFKPLCATLNGFFYSGGKNHESNNCKNRIYRCREYGTAIMKAIRSKFDAAEIYAADPDQAKLEALKAFGVQPCADAAAVTDTCKYVFLAVKPQVIEGVLEGIADHVTADTVLVSIAAGITGEYIQSRTRADAKVILVMPNTPLLLGEGASALAKVAPTTEEEFSFVLSVFAACGKAAVVPADKMKEIIAINGSSPAFIYLYAKGFIDYAASVGIDAQTAAVLFSQSLIGSAKMITDSGYTLDELIKMVSSPGGTTLAGLDALYEGKLTDVAKDACQRCTKRAYELSK